MQNYLNYIAVLLAFANSVLLYFLIKTLKEFVEKLSNGESVVVHPGESVDPNYKKNTIADEDNLVSLDEVPNPYLTGGAKTK